MNIIDYNEVIDDLDSDKKITIDDGNKKITISVESNNNSVKDVDYVLECAFFWCIVVVVFLFVVGVIFNKKETKNNDDILN